MGASRRCFGTPGAVRRGAREGYPEPNRGAVGLGDPEYRLPALALLMCHGIHSMLYVQYAVHESERIVFIRQFRLASDFLSDEEA